MLSFKVISIIGGLIYLYAVVSGLLVYSKLDKASKVLHGLMFLTLIAELTATFCAYKIKNSMVVYGFFGPLQLAFICWYFNEIVDSFRSNNIGIYIAILFAIIGYVDYFILHSPQTFNGNFLIVESLVVNALCLYAFYRMLLINDELNLSKYVHFWFSAIWMFFWTCTFCVWGTYAYLTKSAGIGFDLIQLALLISNVITYVGFGTVFLLYKKMQNVNG